VRQPAPEPAPAVAEAAQPTPEPSPIAAIAAAVPQVRAAIAAFAPAAKPVRAKAKAQRAQVRPASLAARRGNSSAVVQLGAYASPKWVASAWNGIARRHGVLRGYQPMSARFTDARGTFYRLSVKGFASDRDARLVCESLKRSGASCFVRNVAGDAPVRIASR
jgi:hypothetical protein